MYHNQDFYINLCSRFWEEALEKQGSFLFFNAPHNTSIKPLLNKASFSAKAAIEPIIIHEEMYKKELRPFFPFPDIIQNGILEQSEDEVGSFLEKSGVYQFHREIFSTYYANEMIERYEKMIPDEEEYEKGLFRKDLLNQLTRLAKLQPIIILIEGLEYAPPSTLDLIRYYMENRTKAPILLIAVFDKENTQSEFHEDSKWDDFLNFLEKNITIFEIEESLLEQKIVHKKTSDNIGSAEASIRNAWNAFHFLCLEESRDLGLAAYKNISNMGFKINDKNYFMLLENIGNAYTYLSDNENAMIFYNMLLNYAREKKQLTRECDTYRKISFVHYKKNNLDDARKYGRQSLKLANQLKNDLLRFNAYFNLFLINDKSGKESSPAKQSVFYNMEKLAQQLGMDNHLAYTYGVITTQIPNDNNSGSLIEERLVYCDIMINISEQYKNENRLAAAYHNKAMLYSLLSEHDKALTFYKKSERMKLRLGSKYEIIRIYNGLGYGYFLREDYENAYSYFKKSIALLKEIRIYDEIALTLFNMGMVYLFSMEHKIGIHYLEDVLTLMQILHMDTLPFHSIEEVYCVICFAYIKDGRYLESMKYLRKCNPAAVSSKTEERLIYKMLMGLVHLEEGRPEESEATFHEALSIIESEPENLKRFAPRIYYEYGLIVQKRNKQEAKEILKTGIPVAEKLEYHFHKELLTNTAQNKPTKHNFHFSKKPYDTELILELAKTQRTLNKLHNKVSEINFLNNLQNILVQSNEHEDELLQNILPLIDHSFLSEITCLLECNEGSWHVSYSCTSEKKPDYDVNTISEILVSDKKEILIQKAFRNEILKPYAGSLNSIIFIPMIEQDIVKGALFLATKRTDLNLGHDDLHVLSLAAGQLNTALQLLRIKLSLKEAATIDSLTGLFNRQELHRLLTLEEKRATRGKGEHGGVFSVLFIDLDNFKYYNDTFGHHVGDLVLKEFAEILKQITRETDISARFGGDEFIIIMPESDKKDAAGLAARIYKKIQQANHFKEKIEQLLEKKISIPEKYRITCSIGISQYDRNMGINIELLLQQADEALYKAKQDGKNRIHTN